MIQLQVDNDINNLKGEDGDDLFIASSATDGADVIDGGTHTNGDTVNYNALDSNSITVTLANGSNTATVDVSGAGNDDTISNIENVVGTQLGDNITGNDLNNTLEGKEGDDTLSGGVGNDYLDGGTHTTGDTVDYSSASGAITVDLGIDGTAQAIGATEGK